MSGNLYAFNISRQCFLNLGVKLADTLPSRLRGLLGRMKLRSDEAVWMIPSRGIHTIGLMFPVDVIYLDGRMRVVHLIESLGPLRIAPIRLHSVSVLELPARTIYESGTELGDELVICNPEEMAAYLEHQQPAEMLRPKLAG